MRSIPPLAFAVLAFAQQALAAYPDTKVYGVNLGSWLVVEPWMLPAEWVAMGGERCNDCSTCIASEFDFVKAYPDTADARFDKHWATWFTQSDVNELVAAGINTVRIPLGYWIVESLVERKTEFYPRGGIKRLRQGLNMLQAANIQVILDHHAVPGVGTPNQMFAGRCTADVQFYTPANYNRALTWTAVMTFMSHMDPVFSPVFAIDAINEPIMDANLTPGFGEFQKNFVNTVRASELALGISSNPDPFLSVNITVNVRAASQGFNDAVAAALVAAVPILLEMGYDDPSSLRQAARRQPLVTNFQDITWQYNNPSNPADAQKGPQSYDNHLYYSFGGVADPDEDSYMRHICNLDRLEKSAALGNTPMWFGEWSLATNFPNGASDEFLKRWADAQKLAYSKGAGWIFWNFKIEKSGLAGDTARQWSYLEGVRRGYLTRDPSKLNNPNVCAELVGDGSAATV